MSMWLVRVTWIEDEVEATEQWEVNAATVHEAVEGVTMHIRFPPHHVDAKRLPEHPARAATLPPGQARRIPPS